MTTFLVICPTFNHADALFMSISSVRAQDFTDWEMVVIGDGAPERTAEIVEQFSRQDDRIRYVAQPKGPRYGEAYRDPVIRESAAKYVCHLSDDDLWAPDHLSIMLGLLEEADWVTQSEIRLLPNGAVQWGALNHGVPSIREAVRRHSHLSSGLNYVAYRRQTYVDLPVGWEDAPWEYGQSDLYMWAKFMHAGDLRIASTGASGALKLTSHTPERFAATPEARAVELGTWLARIGRPGFLNQMKREASIQFKIARLFSACGGAMAQSVEEACAMAGLRLCEPDAQPNIAVNGAPMDLGLMPAQRKEAENAWLALRCLARGEENAAPKELLAQSLGKDRGAWIKTLHILNQDHPEAALAGVDLLEQAVPDSDRPAHFLRMVLLARTGDTATAQRLLNETPETWQDGADFANARSVVTSFASPSAMRPWQKQTKPQK
ncbi:glycosyltransferase family 2 protein [Pacificoceanicola onchidii]|uniref:glycosyltransferase family 2 protein n=1 Tax=Pacificoceanicola onchidii TaxID=2562685 RepID=UPI0010A3BDF5|nr:glycosyltransferase family A protein [Pacificoceanicola onchidii]